MLVCNNLYEHNDKTTALINNEFKDTAGDVRHISAGPKSKVNELSSYNEEENRLNGQRFIKNVDLSQYFYGRGKNDIHINRSNDRMHYIDPDINDLLIQSLCLAEELLFSDSHDILLYSLQRFALDYSGESCIMPPENKTICKRDDEHPDFVDDCSCVLKMQNFVIFPSIHLRSELAKHPGTKIPLSKYVFPRKIHSDNDESKLSSDPECSIWNKVPLLTEHAMDSKEFNRYGALRIMLTRNEIDNTDPCVTEERTDHTFNRSKDQDELKERREDAPNNASGVAKLYPRFVPRPQTPDQSKSLCKKTLHDRISSVTASIYKKLVRRVNVRVESPQSSTMQSKVCGYYQSYQWSHSTSENQNVQLVRTYRNQRVRNTRKMVTDDENIFL